MGAKLWEISRVAEGYGSWSLVGERQANVIGSRAELAGYVLAPFSRRRRQPCECTNAEAFTNFGGSCQAGIYSTAVLASSNAMAPPTKKNPKPLFKTGVPFTETTWYGPLSCSFTSIDSTRPRLSSVDQDNILDLLCR